MREIQSKFKRKKKQYFIASPD